MVRKHLYFSGIVQGVGFRYRSAWIAESLGLTGWVMNLWDGRVEMEVQGDRKSIDRMLENLHEQRFIRIDRIDAEEIPLKDGEHRFRTR
ncbi:MAG: acylphosphatase [Blautia sp.]|nr:acylphosphatase [Blautia sp.]MDY4515347.1 acylphosphatase [Lachnospiraceae bacterium]